MNKRAGLGIDGNCGFALLGVNIQEGEAEFVEIEDVPLKSPDDSIFIDYNYRRQTAEIRAAKNALEKLRERLNMPELSYFCFPSHPYGR
jgi:hypothetical protein